MVGQNVGSVTVEGTETVVWGRGSIERKQTVSFWVRAWRGLGGASADTGTALKYLTKQVEELASNREQQPAYVQWTATAQGGGALNAVELHDGWYLIDDFEADYHGMDWPVPHVQCRMTVTEVAPGAPRRIAMGYTGGALSSNFSGTATNFISLPVGSTAYETSVTRTGAEGAIPCILSPVASPEPLTLSATIANIFKGGVHVYDTINTGTNPVPTSGGTFINANWVEVFYSDHNFTGDCVITNGLQLLLFVVGQTGLCSGYLWNTATATANWQQYATSVRYYDNAIQPGILRSYSLLRVGPEECSIATYASSSSGQVGAHAVRLQRGRYEVRVDVQPLSQATTTPYGLTMLLPAIPKIVYNSAKVTDDILSEAFPATQTDYGYGAAFIANSAQPYLLGYLYQNQPGTNQPGGDAATADLIHGDGTSLARNAQRSYGFFAIPYGVSGSYSPANLQAEAESGALGTGWTSVADASQSAGNVAKCASGTLATNADLWGTAFVPNPGTYNIAVRGKVTSAASTTQQMQVGLWDSDTAAFVALSTTIYTASQWTTGYTWQLTNIRTVTDGVLNTTTTVTSATAQFNSTADAGKAISGTGIPAGTTISSVTNSTTIVLSAAATATASGVTLRIGAPVTPTATKNMRVRAVTAATLVTDFFFDESAIMPVTLSVDNRGPQELYSQFAYDRSTRLLRP